MKRHQEATIRYTCCTGTQCHRECVIKVLVKDGVIVACEPDDTINSGMAREDEYLQSQVIDKGMLQARPCAKAFAKSKMPYDPNRVRYPMKRVAERGKGQFVRISWDEALDTIAKKLVETKEKHGPLSILYEPYACAGKTGFPLAPWLGAGFAAWGCHSAQGWREPTTWVLGKDYHDPALCQDAAQLFNAGLIVLWGFNPVVTQHGEWGYNLMRAREKGIPIIGIEARYTPSMEALTDQWIPIRPTTDVAMMLAVANVWFKENLTDKEFIERWVEPEGFQRWKAYVMGTEDGIDKTPAWAEEICGVPAETIREFARLYARSKPVNLNVSLSVGRQFYGENPTRAAMYLQALSGNIGIPGGTAAVKTGHKPGVRVGPKPAVDWGRGTAVYSPPVAMAAFKWGKAVDLREKLDAGQIEKEEYNNLIGRVAGAPDLNIQMLVFEGNNHLNNLPDMNATIRGMKKVEFVVAFSQYADMPTARYADILLPQIYTWYEGRNCSGLWGESDLFRSGTGVANYFLYCQKCIEPVGEVKSHDWVWTQIAKRLGIAEQYNPRMATVPEDQWDEAVEELHKEAYEKWATMDDIIPLNPPSWEEFQKKPVFRYEIKDPQYPFKKELERGENPFKQTSSGKIEFYSPLLAKGPQYLATHDYLPAGSGICYGGGNLPPLAKWVAGGRDTFHGKDVEKYPLLMSSPHSYFREHSFLDNSLWLKDECYRHALWISVADAKRRGIKDNDSVKVYNDIGEMVVPAYVTSRIVPGTVCLFHGSWYTPSETTSQLMPEGIDKRGAPNVLTHNEDLPLTIVGFFACKGLVEVEKWEAII
ncbi:molybdopterin-dependent oxidoreductase [Chloroflexota bacterium]